MASSSKITLDVEQLPATAVDTLLSYPSLFDDASSTTPLPQPRTILKEKLYVGNLHPTVDEYTLIKLFSQYGQVSHLDFLFHKTGPHKGKPRGYAFVEFANSHNADMALRATNDKLLRGRKIVVTYANQAPLDQTYGGPGTKHHRTMTESGKPTTLSLMKGGRQGKNNHLTTREKIDQMEAKLKQMERSREDGSLPPPTSLHPSLPSKPIGPAPSLDTTARQRPKQALPSFPMKPPDTLGIAAPSVRVGVVSKVQAKNKLGVKFRRPAKTDPGT